MRTSILTQSLVLVTTFVSSSSALQAIANSPCAVKCGNILSETNGVDDITCIDRDYNTTSKGSLYQSCIQCQLHSKYVDPVSKETDLQWAIYNLRYAVSWCLFGFPNNTEHGPTPCMTRTACGTLENAFEFDSLSPNATAYGYCALMHKEVLPGCTTCLAQSDEFYVTNFVTALAGACEQQPIPGSSISYEGNLFTNIRVNITDPNKVTESTAKQHAGGLPLGAKVGIAVGALVFILIILGCCVVWRGKKKRREVIATRQRQSGYASWVQQQVTQSRGASGHFSAHARSPQPAQQFFDSPQSAKPFFPDPNWGRGVRDEESPVTGPEKNFSPYSSNYSSPISANEQVQVVGRQWPLAGQGGIAALGGKSTVRSRSKERQENPGDRIEMQNVAPVLLHPGLGRR